MPVITGQTEGELLAAIVDDYRANLMRPGDVTAAMLRKQIPRLAKETAKGIMQTWADEHPGCEMVTVIDPSTGKRVEALRKNG